MAGRRHSRALRVMDALGRSGRTGGELGLASARTIAHRTALMREAMADPMKLANPEFVNMATEKAAAASEAWAAMAAGLSDVQRAWLALAQAQMRGMTALTRAMTPGRDGRPAADAMTLVRRGWELNLHAGLRFAESALAFAAAGVAPYHRRASANARRLSGS